MVLVDQEVKGVEGFNMEIEVREKNGDELVFIIRNAEVPFVNAIRRIAMMEVPKIAIDEVNVYVNDSAMFNEVLAHRLGLVPIMSDKEAIEGLPDSDSTVSFTLQKSGPAIVYSGDLISSDSKIKPVYDTIPLLKLKEDENVELEAIARIGKGLDHAKWMPTTVCAYKQFPKITFNESMEVTKEIADACPRNILSFDKENKKINLGNLENCSMCKTCVRTSQSIANSVNSAINVDFIDDTFIFTIESDGSISPEEILLRSCDVLNQKTDKFITFFKGG
jgi:DNA-directed RNA polymerase subunit D